MSENPYAAPESTILTENRSSELEQIRRDHINAEASIRSLGSLYIAGGILALIGSFNLISSHREFSDGAELAGYFIGAIGFPFLAIWLGLKLRKLSNIATIFAGIITLPGLFIFPIGTVVSIFILYALFGSKGRYVVIPEYQSIIDATPHIRYKTSIVIWIILIVLILIALCAIFIAFRSR